MLSVGCHRDQSIAQLTAVQVVEFSKSLVRLGALAGIGVRARQMGRWTSNKQTCTEWLVFALNIVYTA